jgi:TPR repeat protein
LNGIRNVCYEFFYNINILSALLLPAAEAGITYGQYNLGSMLECGEGVEMDTVKALEWFLMGMLL